jgi:hypothetical protein
MGVLLFGGGSSMWLLLVCREAQEIKVNETRKIEKYL